MKEMFQEVEIEVVCFEADADVITASGGGIVTTMMPFDGF